MKRSFAVFLFLSSATLSHAAGRLIGTAEISTFLPGFNWEEVQEKVERVFPTFRNAILSPDQRAIIWIDPKDCQAKDLDARLQTLQTILGWQVILMPSPVDYRILPGGFGYPQIVKTRQLKELFPTLRIRGSKIGENVEVLVVSDKDLSATDLQDRLARAAAIVGRPVVLRPSVGEKTLQ